MSSVTGKIDPRSQREYERAIRTIQDLTKKTPEQMTKMGARFYLQSARKATPIAPKRAPIFRLDGETIDSLRKRGIMATHGFYRYDAGRKRMLIVTADVNDPRRAITMRGLARHCWSYCLGAIGASPGSIPPGSAAAARKASYTHIAGKANSMSITVANRVPYIETLDRGGPHIEPSHIQATGFAMARRRMVGMAKSEQAKFARKWSL